jgi:hypothetical protein
VLPPPPPETKPAPEKRNPDPPKAGASVEAKAIEILSNNCARCHTGARAKGKNMMFNEGGTFNTNVSKEAISKALADGKMPPKGQPALRADDLATLQNWLKGAK